MVRIDFLADVRSRAVSDSEVARHAPDQFGQKDGSASMQKLVWLSGPVVNRHASFQSIIALSRELDTKVCR